MSRPKFLPPPLPIALLALLAAPGGFAQQVQAAPPAPTLPSGPLTQTSREVTPPLTLTPLGEGYVSVQNTSAFSLRASVLVTGAPDDQTRASRADETPCVTLADARARVPQRLWRGPLKTLTLTSGEQVCLWVADPGRNPVPGAQFRVSTTDLGGWVVDSTPRAAERDIVPDGPTVSVELNPWTPPEATTDCPKPIAVVSAQGRSLEICAGPTGEFGGFARIPGAGALGVYLNDRAFGQLGEDGQVRPAPYTLQVRAPVWWAATLIALGLLLPALLKFVADRHREKLALRLALREEALDLKRLPELLAGRFLLDVPEGLLDPAQRIAPSQPFADVRVAYHALLRWREMHDPIGVLPRLNTALTQLEAQFGKESGYRPTLPARHEARVLAFLREVSSGELMGLRRTARNGNYLVGIARASEVVDTLDAARRLARTIERLDLPHLQRLTTVVPSQVERVLTDLTSLEGRLRAAPATQKAVQGNLTATKQSIKALMGLLDQLPGALGGLQLPALVRQLSAARDSVQDQLSQLVDLADRTGSGTLPPQFQAELLKLARQTRATAQHLTDLRGRDSAAFRELEVTLFSARPASASVKDIDEYTARVAALASAALAAATGGTPATVPPLKSNGGDPRGGGRNGTPLGGLLRSSNAELRWVTLPLLGLALLLAVVTGLNELYYAPGAWGSRPLDPLLAVAWGSGAFALQTLLEGTFRLLSGSAWQPGLLRALAGVRP